MNDLLLNIRESADRTSVYATVMAERSLHNDLPWIWSLLKVVLMQCRIQLNPVARRLRPVGRTTVV